MSNAVNNQQQATHFSSQTTSFEISKHTKVNICMDFKCNLLQIKILKSIKVLEFCYVCG